MGVDGRHWSNHVPVLRSTERCLRSQEKRNAGLNRDSKTARGEKSCRLQWNPRPTRRAGLFKNLVANIAEVAEGLKYITPFGYCEGADIVSNGYLDGTLITIGLIFGMVGIVAAYWKYTRKDIHSA